MSIISKFFSFIASAFREDGDSSPLSSRRIALAFIVWFSYISLTEGMRAAFMAGSAGAATLTVALFFVPFVACIAAIMSIVIRLTATNIAQIVDAAKGNKCA